MERVSKTTGEAESDGSIRQKHRDKSREKVAAEEAGKELRPPSRVKLLASDLDIVMVSNLTEGNHTAFGIYDDKTSTISVLDGCSKSATQDTIVHEIIHAILQAYELDSEKIVRVLTPGILSIIRENPDLVKYLQS